MVIVQASEIILTKIVPFAPDSDPTFFLEFICRKIQSGTD